MSFQDAVRFRQNLAALFPNWDWTNDRPGTPGETPVAVRALSVGHRVASGEADEAPPDEAETGGRPTPAPPAPPSPVALPASASQFTAAPLNAPAPPFRRASQIVASQIVHPPELIERFLHRGCKMVLAGGSKSYKSWVLLDLALSLASGTPWWNLRCLPGIVLFLNFELEESFLDARIVAITQAKNIELPGNLVTWTLRQYSYDLARIELDLRERLPQLGGALSAIIVDPIYKALGDLDENSAADMGRLMFMLERLAAPSGAAIIFAAHFSKGNQAGKEEKDRISGSGVFGRDPDAIVTLTPHAEDYCYTVDAVMRYVPPRPSFVVRWGFPVMRIAPGLDPRELRLPPRPTQRPDARNAPATEPHLAARQLELQRGA